MEKNRYRIESVYQAGQVLRAVAESKGAVGSTEIAASRGITVNTAYRMCMTLEELGFLKSVNEKFELGMGLALFWARKKATLEGERVAIEKDIEQLG
jgi:DNA-binding IclR family transcriptional regulator